MSNIKQLYLDGIEPDLLIAVLAECEYMPYILSAFNDTDCSVSLINNYFQEHENLEDAAHMLGNLYISDGELKFYG